MPENYIFSYQQWMINYIMKALPTEEELNLQCNNENVIYFGKIHKNNLIIKK